MANPATVEELLDYWPGNIPFKGSLVSYDGSCMCAQGQALHFLDSMSAEDLLSLDQSKADKRIAELFGISRAHAVLLRVINDRQDGAPTVVVRNPEQVIGDQAQVVLAFWRHLDRISPEDWIALAATKAAARDAARNAARDAARDAAWDAARDAAWAAAWDATKAAAWAAARDAAWAAAWAAEGATNEIQGAAVMRAKGLPFFFLPLFGFADPEAVLAADKA
jgi:hypothetical protein